MLEGTIHTCVLNIYPDTDVISMKFAALPAVKEYDTDWLSKKVEGSRESRRSFLGMKVYFKNKYWQN